MPLLRLSVIILVVLGTSLFYSCGDSQKNDVDAQVDLGDGVYLQAQVSLAGESGPSPAKRGTKIYVSALDEQGKLIEQWQDEIGDKGRLLSKDPTERDPLYWVVATDGEGRWGMWAAKDLSERPKIYLREPTCELTIGGLKEATKSVGSHDIQIQLNLWQKTWHRQVLVPIQPAQSISDLKSHGDDSYFCLAPTQGKYCFKLLWDGGEMLSEVFEIGDETQALSFDFKAQPEGYQAPNFYLRNSLATATNRLGLGKGRIWGRLVGQDLSGGSVSITAVESKSNEVVATASLSEDNSVYALHDLPEGRYRIMSYVKDRSGETLHRTLGRTSVFVTDGQNEMLDLWFGRRNDLFVTAVAFDLVADARPPQFFRLQDVLIEVLDEKGAVIAKKRTNDLGQCWFPKPSEENYTVRASKPGWKFSNSLKKLDMKTPMGTRLAPFFGELE